MDAEEKTRVMEQEHPGSAQTKQMLRRMIALRKREYRKEELEARSERILERILSLEEYQRAETVFAYMALPGEVQTRALIEHCWKEGKRVAVPRVERAAVPDAPEEGSSGTDVGTDGKMRPAGMRFYEIDSFDHLARGAMGILEPDPARCVCLDGEEQALVIMPGVAFDLRGNRLGYGGGCYDRYLQIHPAHPTAAVAYDFQMLDEVPREDTDVRPLILITETLTLQKL